MNKQEADAIRAEIARLEEESLDDLVDSVNANPSPPGETFEQFMERSASDPATADHMARDMQRMMKISELQSRMVQAILGQVPESAVEAEDPTCDRRTRQLRAFIRNPPVGGECLS